MVTRPLSAVSCLDWCGVWVSKLVMSSYNLERERGLGIEQTCQHKGQTLCLLNLLHELNLDSLPNNMLRRTMLAALYKHTHTHDVWISWSGREQLYGSSFLYILGNVPQYIALHYITLHWSTLHYITCMHECISNMLHICMCGRMCQKL